MGKGRQARKARQRKRRLQEDYFSGNNQTDVALDPQGVEATTQTDTPDQIPVNPPEPPQDSGEPPEPPNQPPTEEAQEGPVRPGMSEVEIRAAGVPLDVPFEAPPMPTEPVIRYADGTDLGSEFEKWQNEQMQRKGEQQNGEGG